jgi:putative ABC transport system permease protein
MLSKRALRAWGVLSEAIAGLLQNPGRTVLTMLGTILGLAGFVAVLGLTSTSAGQISDTFTALDATFVTVNDAGIVDNEQDTVFSFPDDVADRVQSLNGVEYGGVGWSASGSYRISSDTDPRANHVELGITIADNGYLEALRPTWSSGGVFNTFQIEERLPVAIMGKVAADKIGVSASGGTVFINDTPYQVVGILDDVVKQPEILRTVIVPTKLGRLAFGEPASFSPAKMIVRTRVGAARQVAGELPLALRPDNPGVLAVVPPADPPRAAAAISDSMRNLFLGVTGITLLVGVAAIANTTLVSVMERTGEIGLRRALGATKGQVVAQFLIESAVLGAVAGIIGAAIGIIAVLGVAVTMNWTALLEPWVSLSAPLIGMAVGLVAGAFPAWKVSRIDPIIALRR